MMIPSVPQNVLVEKSGDGNYRMHPAWQNFFSQLVKSLQTGVNQQDFIIPSQTASNLNLLTAPPLGSRMTYNQDDHLLTATINGITKTIATL